MRNPRVVIFGAGGQTGHALCRLAPAHWELVCPTRWEIDLAADPGPLTSFLGEVRPEVIINASAYNAVEAAEKYPADAHALNCSVVENLANWSADHGCYLVHFSTDYVFSGDGLGPIAVTEKPAPRNAYGRSKAAGERVFLASGTPGCLIRTSAVFGRRPAASGAHNFIEKILEKAAAGLPFPVRNDLHFCPTSADTLARFCLACVRARADGIHHCTDDGATTWFAWAETILESRGFARNLVHPTEGDPPGQAIRPRQTILLPSDPPGTASRPSWQSALHSYLSHA